MVSLRTLLEEGGVLVSAAGFDWDLGFVVDELASTFDGTGEAGNRGERGAAGREAEAPGLGEW